MLQKWGLAPGLLKRLATEADSGISGDDGDLNRRIACFGANTKPLPQIPRLLDSIKESLDNRILLALAIAAFFTIITGMIVEGPKWGWAKGFSIYIAILVIVSVSALNDWIKDKNFVKLQSKVKNEDITVIRGKKGAT